jgi:hypothetical protein
MATTRIPDSALVEGGSGALLVQHGSGRQDEGTVLTRARGSLVWDFEGRENIRCTSQTQSKNLAPHWAGPYTDAQLCLELLRDTIRKGVDGAAAAVLTEPALGLRGHRDAAPGRLSSCANRRSVSTSSEKRNMRSRGTIENRHAGRRAKPAPTGALNRAQVRR